MYKNMNASVDISENRAKVRKLDREGGGDVAAAGCTTQRHSLTYVKAKLINMILFNRLTLLL
jgi:hypothetical protein